MYFKQKSACESFRILATKNKRDVIGLQLLVSFFFVKVTQALTFRIPIHYKWCMTLPKVVEIC